MPVDSSPHLEVQRRIASGDAPFRLYGILDRESCQRRGLPLVAVAEAWRDAGVRLVQYRDKTSSDAEVLSHAVAIRRVFAGTDAVLILNDRAPLVAASGFHGVHVGQGDASVTSVRALLGAGAVLGISTHNPTQCAEADRLDVSYIAVGPVYPTGTKPDAEPVVGLEGIRTARYLTRRPLVAIGGITLDRAPEVWMAGADSVASISALLPTGEDGQESIQAAASRFLHLPRPARR